MFLGFANFYQLFIKKFSKIAISLIFILEMTNNRQKTDFMA